MMKQVRIAILGASGYTGAELIRLLKHHPAAQIIALTGESQAGKPLGDVYAHLDALKMPLQRHEEVDFSKVDVVFCCLPHGTTQPIIAGLPKSVKVVDLSADFRLFDSAEYAKWYGHTHQAEALQKEAVYGLCEWRRETIAKARLIANPGCYPTSILLPLLPLLKAKLIDPKGLIADSMSGVTGAGRKAAQANLYCEVNEAVRAYGVGNHRHVAEIEQELSQAAGEMVMLSFTPHLVPMNRGISSTIHVTLGAGQTADTLRAHLQQIYAKDSFVWITDHVPSTAEVRGTNGCRISVSADRVPGKAIIVSVIDNLGKGASGQAIQNMNLICGFPETTGLEAYAVFP